MEDLKKQAMMLNLMKPVLKEEQGKVIDILVLISEAGKEWTEDNWKATLMLNKIREIVKE